MHRPSPAGGPLRTCVGCRQREAITDLLRVVLTGQVLVIDTRRRMAGRGAHLHPREQCLVWAERRRAWTRAFGVTGPCDASALAAAVRQIAQDRAGRPPAPDFGQESDS